MSKQGVILQNVHQPQVRVQYLPRQQRGRVTLLPSDPFSRYRRRDASDDTRGGHFRRRAQESVVVDSGVDAAVLLVLSLPVVRLGVGADDTQL